MGEVLPKWVASPAYTAVSERLPPVKAVGAVVMVASPDPSSAAVPKLRVPDLKVRLPVGVSAVEEVTCATSVTAVPYVGEAGAADMIAVVVDAFTFCVNMAEVLGLYRALPE